MHFSFTNNLQHNSTEATSSEREANLQVPWPFSIFCPVDWDWMVSRNLARQLGFESAKGRRLRNAPFSWFSIIRRATVAGFRSWMPPGSPLLRCSTMKENGLTLPVHAGYAPLPGGQPDKPRKFLLGGRLHVKVSRILNPFRENYISAQFILRTMYLPWILYWKDDVWRFWWSMIHREQKRTRCDFLELKAESVLKISFGVV